MLKSYLKGEEAKKLSEANPDWTEHKKEFFILLKK